MTNSGTVVPYDQFLYEKWIIDNIAFFLGSIKMSYGQTTDSISKNISEFYKQYPQEKLFLQTNQNNFQTGELIFFAAYVLVNSKPGDFSSVIYIQLVNHRGKVVTQAKLPIIDGHAEGSFIIPDSLATNYYEIRAFTAWMLNFSESYIFHKIIYINNSLQSQDFLTEKQMIKKKFFQVKFFPEGGTLLNNISSTIAVKVTDQNGLPAFAKGIIRNEMGDSVNFLRIIHDGMGSFSFRPGNGHAYHAEMLFEDGSRQTVNLPATDSFGITLKIMEQTEKRIDLEIFWRTKTANLSENLQLLACESTGMFETFPVQVNKGKNDFSINVEALNTGIIRLLLLDSLGCLLAQRNSFFDKDDRLSFDLIKDTFSVLPSAHNQFKIVVSNPVERLNNPVFSVSVTDATLDTFKEDNNIYSSILLTSESDDTIYDPGYYFISKNETTKNALDLLMLTHSFRKLDWAGNSIHKKQVLKYAPEKHVYIAGRIENYSALKGKDFNLTIIIQSEDSTRFIGFAEPDSNAQFVIKDYGGRGKSIVFYSATQKDKPIDISVKFLTSTIDSVWTAPFLSSLTYHMDSTSHIIKRLLFDDSAYHYQKGDLKPVTILSRRPSKTEETVKRYVSPFFSATNAVSIDLENSDYTGSMDIMDLLMQKVPGLSVHRAIDSNNNDIAIFNYRGHQGVAGSGASSNRNGGSAPYFYLNEILTSWDDIKNVSVQELGLIQFIPAPSPMAPLNGGFIGVISVYTKKFNSSETSAADKKVKQFVFTSYALNNTFSVFRDFSDTEKKSKINMQESLYWNPTLELNKEGEAKFDFFTRNTTKKILIKIIGINSQGEIISLNTLLP